MAKNKNKRKATGITGLARFVLESFNTDNATASSSTELIQGSSTSSTTTQPSASAAKRLKIEDGTPVDAVLEPSQLDGHGLKEQSSEVVEVTRVNARKTVRRYDATGTVPHYEDASEVPEHLQKCTFYILTDASPCKSLLVSPTYRLLAKIPLLLVVLGTTRLSLGRRRVVQCNPGEDCQPNRRTMPM